MRTSPVCMSIYAFLCVLITFAAHSQTDRYVDPGGDNTGPNDCSNSGTPCQTIVYAISQSVASDTINLAAGTYSESITINIDITLKGANVGTAATGTRVSESIINPASNVIAISVTATGVTIDGIQIGASNASSNATTGIFDNGSSNILVDNSIIYANSVGIDFRGMASGTVGANENVVEMLDLEDQTNTGTGSIGILLSGLTGTINAELVNNNLTGASWGIFGYNLDNSSDHLLINGGTYSGCTKGIEIDNADGVGGFSPSLVDILNVTMSGFLGPFALNIFPDAQAGIYSFVGSGTSLDDVTLSIDNADVSGVRSDSSDFSGIYMAGFATVVSGSDLNLTITNSNIHDNLNRGFYIRGATTTASISQCTITGNGFDPRVVGGNPGFSIISRVSATTTVSNCTISNAAVQTNDSTVGLESEASTMTVTDCSITNNGNGSIAQGVSGGVLDLSRNWFGSTNETTISGLINTLAEVDFTPWIGSGTDTDGGTMGFQPDLSTLYVGTSGTQTGATGRWQEGHNLANTLGTVVLAFADYAETVTVSKNITFQPTSSGTDTSLDNLVMNGVGQTLTINGNLLIDNGVTLTNGIIDVNTGELRLGVSASNLSESANSRVTGMVTMDPRNVGTGSIDLLGVNIAAGASDDLGNVTIVRNSGSNAIIVDGPNSSISASWDITVGTQPTNAGRDVTFTWRSEFDNGKDMTMMSVFRNNGSGWTQVLGPVDASGSDPRTISVTAVTGFSEWTLAQDNQPLPVDLVSFDATAFKNYIALSWSTMIELNSDHFEIQKSVDGKNFQRMSSVKAAGNSNERIDYKWEDKSSLIAKYLYYRLKTVDVNGSFEFSKTIVVSTSLALEMEIYPNPTHDFIKVNYWKSSFRYSIVDQSGKLIRSEMQSEGRIDISTLKNGIYLLRVDFQDFIRFIVEN